MTRIVSLLMRRPRLTLAAMFAVSAVALAGIHNLRFDGSVASLTDPDDPARRIYQEVWERFGEQEIGVFALLVEDVYQPPVLDAIRGLTSEVAKIEGVDRVLSVANAADPAADVVAPPPVLPYGPVTAASAQHVRERVAANPIYVPHLVARDGRAAAVNVFFEHDLTAEGEERIDDDFARLLEAWDGPGELYYTGMSHIRVRASEIMREDLTKFLPLSLLAMMVVLWLSFGSFRAVVLPLASISTGVGILLGIMGWLDEPITLATLVLPSLLVVIGGSYAVHVTAVVLDESDPAQTGPVSVITRVGLPMAASALTTAVGFGSLAFHPIPAISGLGLYAVVGILVMAVGTLFGLTAAFYALPPRAARRARAVATSDGWVERATVRLAAAAVDHRRQLFVVAIVVAVVAAAGAWRVRVTTDLVTAFRESSDIRQAYNLIAERLAGPNPLSIVLTAPEPGYFRSVVSLRRVKDFQDFLHTLDGIDSSLSLVDYLDELDLGLQASGGDLVIDDQGEVVESPPPPSFWDAPAEQLPQIFDLVRASPDTFAGVVDDQFQEIRITARTAVSGSRETKRLVEAIESYAHAMFPRGVEITVTGNLVVISSVADRVLSGQIESVALAFTVIFAVLVFLFLSFRVGIAAMIPNVLPVLIFFGVMGWGDLELNLATSIIAAVALGIAVDDTIHYMARLNRIVKVSPSQRDALLLTMQTVGRPVVATSMTLTAGFLVMVLSGFALISGFGLLSALTMMVALATNVVLLPAVLATVPVVSVWDLVAFRLGPSPHTTIPLFNGLGRFAVRLIVLLGRIESFLPGQAIMRHGERGEAMFMILTGNAEVRTSTGAVLASLSRGDVVGEMGVLRRTVRTADVIATSEVEALAIDEAFLRRLQTLYPRFASRFFLNIARILSDRLEQANRRLGLFD